MLWLALQFPRLGLEVWREAPDDRPTVLLEENRVVLRDHRADALGILPGCTLATAHSITARLLHFHRDEGRERARLEFLAQLLYRFSAQVSLAPPDGVVLEIGGSLELFGDAGALAHRARTLCRSLGHEVRWQLASTPQAALIMARADVRRLEEVPIAHAQIPGSQKNVERLANMGMRTLEPLLNLPGTELGQRFGPELVGYLDRLCGRAADPRAFIEPSLEFDQALHLLEPVKDKEALLFPMQRLLGELSHWLVGRQLGTDQLIWSFSTHTKDERVVLPVRFARPLQSRESFMGILRLRLEQVALPEEILNVRLQAARLGPWVGGSRSLFRLLSDPAASGAVDDTETIALIDQLNARLGERACSGITLEDRHAPESAWAPVRPHVGSKQHPTVSDPARRWLRPLWLFDPPHLTRRECLTLLEGPERLKTEWWQQTVWRDYYVASLESGAKCWVFVDGRNQWFVHGYFG